MRRMKKRGPNVLYDLNDLLFSLHMLPLCTIRHCNQQSRGSSTNYRHAVVSFIVAVIGV